MAYPSPESGDYEWTVDAHGWLYNVMQDHNRGLNPKDHAGLFRNAYMVNGAQRLDIRQARLLEQPQSAEIRFVGQITYNDGGRFSSGPCYGDNDLDVPQ